MHVFLVLNCSTVLVAIIVEPRDPVDAPLSRKGSEAWGASKELIHRRKKENEIDRMHKDLNTVEQHLKYCKRANAMATLLAAWRSWRFAVAMKKPSNLCIQRDSERHVYSYTTEKMLDISVERRFPVNCSGVLYLPKRFTHAP